MTSICALPLAAALGLAALVPGQPQTAAPMPLTGGGEISLRESGDSLLVHVKGPGAGLASLCVGDESHVRILHASAAVGEATYEKAGDRWALRSGFDWKLRESPTGGGSPEGDARQHLATKGWIANASRAGTPVRDFTIRLSDRIRFIGVTFLSIAEPPAISYWPPSLDDDCRSVRIAQGHLPARAHFRPSSWHRVRQPAGDRSRGLQ